MAAFLTGLRRRYPSTVQFDAAMVLDTTVPSPAPPITSTALVGAYCTRSAAYLIFILQQGVPGPGECTTKSSKIDPTR